MPFFSTVTTGTAQVSDKSDASSYPGLVCYALLDGFHFVPKGQIPV